MKSQSERRHLNRGIRDSEKGLAAIAEVSRPKHVKMHGEKEVGTRDRAKQLATDATVQTTRLLISGIIEAKDIVKQCKFDKEISIYQEVVDDLLYRLKIPVESFAMIHLCACYEKMI